MPFFISLDKDTPAFISRGIKCIPLSRESCDSNPGVLFMVPLGLIINRHKDHPLGVSELFSFVNRVPIGWIQIWVKPGIFLVLFSWQIIVIYPVSSLLQLLVAYWLIKACFISILLPKSFNCLIIQNDISEWELSRISLLTYKMPSSLHSLLVRIFI